MIAGVLRRFRTHKLIGQLHSVVQVNHGKSPSAVGRNLSRLQGFQAHPVAGIVLLLPLFRHPVQMVEPHYEGFHALHPSVVGTHLLSLGQRHRFEATGKRRFLLRHIFNMGIPIHLLRREIEKPSTFQYIKCRQDIHEPCGIPHCLLSRLRPVEVRIERAGEHRHVRLDTLQNLLDAPAVIWKIVLFKYMPIRRAPLPLPCQQIDPVPVLIQLIDHRIHQCAAAAYQQYHHLYFHLSLPGVRPLLFLFCRFISFDALKEFIVYLFALLSGLHCVLQQLE